MSFGVSLITVSPNTTIHATDANTNWEDLNNATVFTGKVICNSGYGVTLQFGSSITFPSSGALADINYFGGSGSGVFTHGLNATPHTVAVGYAGNFGGPPTQHAYYYNLLPSTVQVVAQSGYSWLAIAYRY